MSDDGDHRHPIWLAESNRVVEALFAFDVELLRTLFHVNPPEAPHVRSFIRRPGGVCWWPPSALDTPGADGSQRL